MSIESSRRLGRPALYWDRFLTKMTELMFGVTHSGTHPERRIEVARDFISNATQRVCVLSKDGVFYSDPSLLNAFNNVADRDAD